MRCFDTGNAAPTRRGLIPATTADPDHSWPHLQPLPTLEPACCCSARPKVTVLLSTARPGSQTVDLLMCGHHFRSAQASLEAAGAVALDAQGRRIALATEPA